MKRFTRTVFILLAVSSAAFTSCKKDDEDPKPKTKAEMLTAKNWRISAASFTVGATTQDAFASLPACSKDDFTKFNADKTLLSDEGTTRCNSSDPQTVSGAWDLTSNDSKLLLQETPNSSSAELYDILELSDSTLKIKQTETINGTTYIVNITFTSF